MESHWPKPKQMGFGAIEVLLIVLVVAVLTVTSFVVYQRRKPGDSKNNAATGPSQTTTSSPQISASPTAFVTNVLRALASGSETQLTQFLTPAFKGFREHQLVTGRCNDNGVLLLTCDSLLNTQSVHALASLTPHTADYVFKDGLRGKIVFYQLAQDGSDPGTTYFTFYLLPRNKNWLLNDYRDVFVNRGTTYSLLPGKMEQE